MLLLIFLLHHSFPLQGHVKHVELHSLSPLFRQVGQITDYAHQVQLRLLHGLVCVLGDRILGALWEAAWSVSVAVSVERILENVIVGSTLYFGEILALVVRILDSADDLIKARLV